MLCIFKEWWNGLSLVAITDRVSNVSALAFGKEKDLTDKIEPNEGRDFFIC